ncbi:hypothetical protein LTR09_011282 [Extremus antarcticus]|uniref:Uncharacterized protein n=1 Tax=Extremus antarcticus TaxID=702011 RepID=A0AAJ0D6K5_9PEZI|nr:hypothetical protein LTR09_011282 [Extremus antarcticus]
MASLLSLPVELLDRIIDLVVLNARKPPVDVPAARTNRWKDEDLSAYSQGVRVLLTWPEGPRHVRYEHKTSANATGLLLTNRQFHKPTQDAITRLFPNGISYVLDVLNVNDKELWPTWLYVPVVAKHLASVQVNLRFFEHVEPCDGFTFNAASPSNDDLRWCYWSMLERILRCGLDHPPPTLRGSPYRGHAIESIESISIDITAGVPLD